MCDMIIESVYELLASLDASLHSRYNIIDSLHRAWLQIPFSVDIPRWYFTLFAMTLRHLRMSVIPPINDGKRSTLIILVDSHQNVIECIFQYQYQWNATKKLLVYFQLEL